MCTPRQWNLCGNTECNTCYPRSLSCFLSTHNLHDHWIAERNTGVDINLVMRGSSQMYWFRCKNCSHLYQSSSKKFTETLKTRCGYCATGRGAVLCNDNNCSLCLDRSLASFPGIQECWIYEKNNNLDPRHIRKASNTPYWFKCKLCSHPYQTDAKNFSRRGGCTYCSDHGRGENLCKDLECKQCYNRSLQYILDKKDISSTWISSPDGREPRYITKFSSILCTFQCQFCNNPYVARPYSVMYNHWCSCRKNKTESKVLSWLRENYPEEEIIHDKSLPFLPRRRYDFILPRLKIIIEIDGPQHFIQISNWISPSITMKVDITKMIKANRNLYTVIRIPQEDIWNDTNRWYEHLREHLHPYESPTCIFIGDDYKLHEALLKRGTHLQDMINGKDTTSTRSIRSLMKVLHVDLNIEERIFLNRDNQLDNLNRKIVEGYRLSDIPNELYSGIRRFFTDIVGIDIDLYIHRTYIVISPDEESSLYSLLQET